MEMTYTGNPGRRRRHDLIDYFSVPLALNVYQGGVSGSLVGSVTGAAVNPAMKALRRTTVPAGAAEVKDGHDFVRMIGPGVYPAPPGLPASPYDDFQTYLAALKKLRPAPWRRHGEDQGSFRRRRRGRDARDHGAGLRLHRRHRRGPDVTLTGSGTVVGSHTLTFANADLVAPTGIYGANPSFSIDGAAKISPQNDVYGWIVGDLLAGPEHRGCGQHGEGRAAPRWGR